MPPTARKGGGWSGKCVINGCVRQTEAGKSASEHASSQTGAKAVEVVTPTESGDNNHDDSDDGLLTAHLPDDIHQRDEREIRVDESGSDSIRAGGTTTTTPVANGGKSHCIHTQSQQTSLKELGVRVGWGREGGALDGLRQQSHARPALRDGDVLRRRPTWC